MESTLETGFDRKKRNSQKWPPRAKGGRGVCAGRGHCVIRGAEESRHRHHVRSVAHRQVQGGVRQAQGEAGVQVHHLQDRPGRGRHRRLVLPREDGAFDEARWRRVDDAFAERVGAAARSSSRAAAFATAAAPLEYFRVPRAARVTPPGLLPRRSASRGRPRCGGCQRLHGAHAPRDPNVSRSRPPRTRD